METITAASRAKPRAKMAIVSAAALARISMGRNGGGSSRTGEDLGSRRAAFGFTGLLKKSPAKVTGGQSSISTAGRKAVPTKLLIFPEKGRWVLKPGNSELWHRTVFAWLPEYLKP